MEKLSCVGNGCFHLLEHTSWESQSEQRQGCHELQLWILWMYTTYKAPKTSHETSHPGRGLRLDYVLVSESLVPDEERSHETAQFVDNVTIER